MIEWMDIDKVDSEFKFLYDEKLIHQMGDLLTNESKQEALESRKTISRCIDTFEQQTGAYATRLLVLQKIPLHLKKSMCYVQTKQFDRFFFLKNSFTNILFLFIIL